MPITPQRTDALARALKALGDETRLRVVAYLATGERCVCHLVDDLDVPQSLLSFHLKKLKDAGVISDRRDGRWVYYSLIPETLEQMREFLGEMKPQEDWGNASGRGGQCCS